MHCSKIVFQQVDLCSHIALVTLLLLVHKRRAFFASRREMCRKVFQHSFTWKEVRNLDVSAVEGRTIVTPLLRGDSEIWAR